MKFANSLELLLFRYCSLLFKICGVFDYLFIY
jgi:hypothetical protein